MCGTTEALTDAWHQVSKPFVDTGLGRMAVNVATGGNSAPFFAAYDISNGADPMKAAVGGAMGYFGGQAGNDWLSGANAPTAAGMSEQMGDWTPGALDNPEVAAHLGISVPGQGGNTGVPPTAAGMSEQMGDWTPKTYTGLRSMYPSNVPLENTVGASMNTSSLSQTGSNAPWYQRAMSSAKGELADLWSPEGIGKSLGKIGPAGILSGLAGMYTSNKTANAQQDRFNQVQNQVNGMYAPGSPEYEALMQQIARTDAAAGRNSQVGPRSVDLAAKIAQYKANALSGTLQQQNTMFNSSLNNRNQGLSGLFGVYGRANPQQ